jgi:hypothetical protein
VEHEPLLEIAAIDIFPASAEYVTMQQRAAT